MGHGLPMESLRWLRDFTIEKIRVLRDPRDIHGGPGPLILPVCSPMESAVTT